MEPWGTPYVIFVLSDLKVAIETKQSLAFKYDSNHFNTLPERPTHFSN